MLIYQPEKQSLRLQIKCFLYFSSLILHPCVLVCWDLLTVMNELLLRRVRCVWFVGKSFGGGTDCLSEMHVANADCVFSILSNASNVSYWKYCNDYLMWRNHDTHIPLQITIIIIFVIHLYWGTRQMGIMGKWRCPFFGNRKFALCYCGQLVPGGLCKYCDQFKEASNLKEIATLICWHREHDGFVNETFVCVDMRVFVWGDGLSGSYPSVFRGEPKLPSPMLLSVLADFLPHLQSALLNIRITIHVRQLSSLHKP